MLKLNKFAAPLALVAVLALALAGCGGGSPEPTPTPVPPTAAPALTPTTAATTAATASATSDTTATAAPDSPLAQPVSPLAPESPLALPPATDATGRPLSDMAAIDQIAAANQTRTPQPGMASLAGTLVSTSVKTVIPGNLVYLTQALEENGKLFPPNVYAGPDATQGDVTLQTDEYGRINADNIPPGNYVIAVWTVYNYIIIPDPTITDRDYPKIFEIKAGDQLDLGKVEISWP